MSTPRTRTMKETERVQAGPGPGRGPFGGHRGHRVEWRGEGRPFIFFSPPPCNPAGSPSDCGHENRHGDLDYLLDYLLLTPVRGAVFFIPKF